MTYGNDNVLGLFIEIRDRSFDDFLMTDKSYNDYDENYTKEEFAQWLVDIADDYNFELSVDELMKLEA